MHLGRLVASHDAAHVLRNCVLASSTLKGGQSSCRDPWSVEQTGRPSTKALVTPPHCDECGACQVPDRTQATLFAIKMSGCTHDQV